MGVGSHVSITLWCSMLVGAEGFGGRGGGAVRSAVSLLPILLYVTSRFAYMEHLFCWQLLLIFLYLTSDWMFFFHALATVFTTSCHGKNVCCRWVWKFSNDACPLNLIRSASFLTQSDWLEKKANQSLCIRKETLGTRLMPTKIMVRW